MLVCDMLAPVIIDCFMILHFIENVFLDIFRNHCTRLICMFLIVDNHRLQQVSTLGILVNTQKRTLAQFRNSCIRIFEKILIANMIEKFRNHKLFEKYQNVVFFLKILILSSSRKSLSVCEIISSMAIYFRNLHNCNFRNPL